MMNRSGKKFADILTILLVIVIIGVIGLLGYFAYQAVSEKQVETAAQEAMDEFYRNTSSDDEEEEVIENESSASLADLVDTTTTTTTSTETTDSSAARTKTYYEGYEIKGTINIKETGCNYPILEKVTVGSLKIAVGILDIATCDEITTTVTELNIPGTNALILGHNYRNSQFFSKNDQLELGDTIEITDTLGETVTYTIYKMYYTSADDISFMERTLDANTREITLQTCNDDSSQRLIIWAKDN